MNKASTRLTATVVGTVALIGILITSSAAYAAAPTITSLSPSTGPIFSSIPVKIHGSGFSTEAGGTTVTFGSEASTSVTCTSTKLCTAETPAGFGLSGPVSVTATVGGITSNAATYTAEGYSPPVVKIITRPEGPIFGQAREVVDTYPGIFASGNVYLNIENTTEGIVTITANHGLPTLEVGPGETAGYNIALSSEPYEFSIDGATHEHNRILIVKTKARK
jgi:hypothetical protein